MLLDDCGSKLKFTDTRPYADPFKDRTGRSYRSECHLSSWRHNALAQGGSEVRRVPLWYLGRQIYIYIHRHTRVVCASAGHVNELPHLTAQKGWKGIQQASESSPRIKGLGFTGAGERFPICYLLYCP